MTVPSLADHQAAIVAALQGAGLVTGDGGPPTVPHGWQQNRTFIDYAIVYPLPGQFDGTLEATNSDADLAFQITCVARTLADVLAVEDTANGALLDTALTVAGRSVLQVRLDGTGNARRDTSVNPPLNISTPRYRYSTTPA
jgi:hypothetical protein